MSERFFKDVYILGKLWKVEMRSEDEEKRLIGTNGFADWSCKLIVLTDPKKLDGITIGNASALMHKVIAHEVIHAYMYECGLAECWEHSEYGQDEMTVDWFAFKLNDIYQTVSSINLEYDMFEKNRTESEENETEQQV